MQVEEIGFWVLAQVISKQQEYQRRLEKRWEMKRWEKCQWGSYPDVVEGRFVGDVVEKEES